MTDKGEFHVGLNSPDIPIASYWLPAIIESANDAIISKTLDGIITSWNTAAERIFGYAADEVIGKSILMIIPPELRQEEVVILKRIRRGERIEHFETIRMRKDDSRVHISLTISPIKTPDGRVIGASKIARDITDRIYAERERQRLLKDAEEARRQAETANQAKDNFLALLSHELRTPLHSMRGWLSMLASGVLPKEQRSKAIEVIMRGVDTQNALVEDLLDVSRIVAGKLALNCRPISLISVVSNTVEQMKPVALENGITLRAELDPSTDNVYGDEARLQQIVSNLINNAIKYTPAGGTIDVSLIRQGDTARLNVRDSGIGIPPDLLPRIFGRFEQGDNTSRRAYGGLGLGLTIARHLAELHGGSITAASDGEGRGSSFTITLPLVKSLSASYHEIFQNTNQLDGDQNGDCRLDRTRVLIVEDDLDSLEMLRIVLESAGADVTSVDRGEKAVVELGRRKFDVMISDLGLPEMDGHDLIREVRGTLALDAAALPAIALSGYVAEDDRHRSLTNGFQLHLQKPLDIATLAPTIRYLLDQINRR